MSTQAPWFRTHPASPLLSGGVVLLACGAVLIRIILKELFTDEVELGVFGFIVLGGVVLVLLIIGGSYLLWRRTCFCLTEEFLYQRSGKHNKQTIQIELTAVTAVDLKRSFLARIFGLAELIVRPSAGDPLSISLLPLEQAHNLRRQILTSASPSTPEDAVLDTDNLLAPAAVLDDGEVLATLNFKRQVTALAYRAVALGIPAVILAGTAGIIVLTVVDLPADFWELPTAGKTGWVLALQITLFTAAAGLTLLKMVSGNYQATVRSTDNRLSLKRGLLTEVTSSLPLAQVHWIELSQPWYWKKPGWWRLRARSLTSLEDDDDTEDSEEDGAKASEILLPVATIEEVAPLLDLLSRNTAFQPQEVLDTVLRRADLSQVSAPRAKMFNPITHGHEGAVWTGSALLIRSGRFSTKLTVIPYANIQGTNLAQGPLQNPLGLGNVTIFGAKEIKSATVRNLDVQGATALFNHVRATAPTHGVQGTPT